MKRLLVPLIVAAAMCLVVYQLYSSGEQAKQELAAHKDLTRIQLEYLERVPLLRSNPDADAYRSELPPFFQWYLGQISEHHKRFGGNAQFDGYLAGLEARGAQDPNYAAKKQAFNDVSAVFKLIRENHYKPLWTATDRGMRMDILDDKIEMIGGEPTVVLPMVLWGAQREVRDDGKGIKTMLTSASFSIDIRLLDAKGRFFGGTNGAGDPAGKVDHPERFIPEFPAQTVLGKFHLPMVPSDVAKAEITFNVTTTPSHGAPVLASYKWNLDVPAAWKLRPGEEWKGAEVSERSAEEINAANAR